MQEIISLFEPEICPLNLSLMISKFIARLYVSQCYFMSFQVTPTQSLFHSAVLSNSNTGACYLQLNLTWRHIFGANYFYNPFYHFSKMLYTSKNCLISTRDFSYLHHWESKRCWANIMNGFSWLVTAIVGLQNIAHFVLILEARIETLTCTSTLVLNSYIFSLGICFGPLKWLSTRTGDVFRFYERCKIAYIIKFITS